MKRFLQFFLLIFALSASAVLRAETDAEVNARKDALELAGAFGNDGFKIRDGHSCGVLKPHDHILVAVNLYSGNQYWFSVGTTDPLKKVGVSVYDESGNQMTT